MKKYMLLIVLFSFMSQLQAAADSKKTLALQNSAGNYSYRVTYTPQGGQQVTVSLGPDEYKMLDHNFNQITEMSFSSDAALAIPHTVNMGEVSQAGGAQYNHLVIVIERGLLGSSYKVIPDPKKYAGKALEGFIQGATQFANFLSGAK